MDGIMGGGMLRGGPAARRFDEYYRCYPVAMLPGPERENVNHGGKVIMPPSALDKLTRLHISYALRASQWCQGEDVTCWCLRVHCRGRENLSPILGECRQASLMAYYDC